MKQFLRRIGICSFVFVLLTVAIIPVTAAPADQATALTLVDEPNNTSDDVYFYRGKDKIAPTEFSWVSGRAGGQALRLNGESEYLRVATAVVKDLDEFSLSLWVKREGDASLRDEALFCFYKNENHYLSLTPHAEDSSLRLNGIRMIWADRDFDTIDLFKAANANRSFALPLGEWHHLIITAGNQRAALYVDGTLYFEMAMTDIFTDNAGFADLGLRNFQIGADLNKKSNLHALIDDAYLYDRAFDNRQALLAYQGKNPLSKDEPDQTNETLATSPTAATSATTAEEDGEPSFISSTLILALIIIVLFIIILSVFLSLREKRRHEKEVEEVETGSGETPDIPLIINLPLQEESQEPIADSEEDTK